MTGENFQPERLFAVSRLRQQIGSYSSAGGILTGFEGPARGAGRKRSMSAGVDGDLRFAENAYGINGFLSTTHEAWSSEGRGAESGFAGSVRTEKRSGAWRYEVNTTIFGPDFDPNDLGQLRRNNYIKVGGSINHDFNGGQPFGPFQRAGFFSFLGHRWSYEDRVRMGVLSGIRSQWVTRNFQTIGLGYDGDNLFGGYDLFETRGLGPAQQPSEVGIETEFETDSRRDWEGEPGVGITWFGNGTNEYSAELRGNWTVGSRLTLSANLETAWERAVVAWSSNDAFRATDEGDWAISTVHGPPDELGPEDYAVFAADGRLDAIFADLDPYPGTEAYYRPVSGGRDTREMDLTVRSNVTFAPDLSLELYGQVFVARGRYEDFRILKDPDTFSRFEGYPKRDEFTLNSFQLNTVLRWQYRPGSTFFLVWTQSRWADRSVNPLADPTRSVYDVPIGEQLSDTFGLFPTNTLLAKIEYTFLR